jgi:mono/diheme cytochrome c family protein
MSKQIRSLSISLLAVALLLTACNFSLAQDITPPPGYQPPVFEELELITGAAPVTAPDPANGAAIYEEKCQACHGPTGLGDGPDSTALPNAVARIGAADVVSQSSPLAWYSITLQGNIERFMPPFSGSLTSSDVWDVLAYVYTFSADAETIAAGETLFTETCAACHGPDGSGSGAPGAANLLDAERMVLLSINDLVQKIATGSGNEGHVFSTELDAAQIEAVSLYVRSLLFPLEGQAADTEPASEPEPEVTDAPDSEPTAEATAEPAGEETGDPTEEPGETEPDGDTGTDTTEEQPVAAVDDDLGTVTGTVNNGSGGDVPAGLEVRLEVYEAFELVDTVSTTLEQDASFRFEDIEILPDRIYLTVVEKDGLFFPSNFHVGSDTAGNAIELPVTIYDTTTDTSDLAVSRLHIFFTASGENTIQVIHQVSISNRGNQMVAPDEGIEAVLEFTLPEGATNLVFQAGSLGNPYLQTPSGFADPSPVLPGENTYEGLFAYNLPLDGDLEWRLPADLPTDVAVIFVQGEDARVSSDTLIPSGSEVLDQDVFQVLVADNIPAGQEIELTISQPLFGSGDLSSSWVTIVLGVVGLGLAVFGVWRFFAPTRLDDDEMEEDLAEDDPDALIAAIIALDEAHEEGQIDTEEYQRRRAVLKAELGRLVNPGSDS